MGKRQTTTYACRSCGAMQQSWAGKCPQCGEWGTLEEQALVELVSGLAHTQTKRNKLLDAKQVSDISVGSKTSRLLTHDKQIDSVLGGGLVAGSIVLLAGQPGIGKSTLLLQIAHSIAADRKVLYVSAEESAQQVALRAQRLGRYTANLQIASSTITNDIAHTIMSSDYDVVVVDSIQTIGCREILSTPGTVSQITNSTNLLTQAAKQSNTTLIVVGHVTKDGSIAGPKLLEHSVDVVLQFEGDRYGGFKVVRSVKNRFGATHESAIYQMLSDGLVAVENPSAALLEERSATDGSVVLAIMEGSRPLLVEVQALVNRTSYGYPKRTASGFDLNRLNLLIAVMEKRARVSLSDKDVYVNIVGGIDVDETAADLAICLAIASAAKGVALRQNLVVFGEVGLSGEIRFVPYADKRIAEARKLGFSGAIGPTTRVSTKQASLQSVSTLTQAIDTFLPKA